MYFLIGVWGGEDRRYASLKFFLYTLFGSALMIISFLALFFLSKDAAGEFLYTFDMRALTDAAGVGIIKSTQVWIFAGLFMGFGIKVPMFPFHTWLPDAHTQAPTVGSVILAAVLLLAGLFILVKAGDIFVDSAAQLARSLNMSSVVVGAIVLGFGTSAPELVVSTIAAWGGNPALGVGNIVGSNVANLSLVLGVSALVTPIVLSASVIRRQAPLSIASVILFAVLLIDEKLSLIEGALLLGLLIVAMFILIKTPGEGAPTTTESTSSTGRSLLLSIVGLCGVLVGAQLAVSGATTLAERWGLSGGFIGFSLVALGTSLPELVTAVAAARRNETGLIIGNLFGSNLFNCLAGGAAIGLVNAGDIGDPNLTSGGLVAMVLAVTLAYVRGAVKRQISKSDAILLLGIYIAAMLYLALA